MNSPVPVNSLLLNSKAKAYLNECIDSGWVSSEGPFVTRFEEQFAARMGRQFGVAVTNGSAALEVAVAALEIGPGDEVILPTFTIISCAAAIVRAGAIPVLVDSDPLTWNADVEQIEARISARTKAIMVVHTYGLPADMDRILAIAQKNGLRVIEDAAEMHGQTYKSRPCGSFGDVSIFSFYPNKHVTTGEGGMVLTNDPAIAEKCRSLRNLCFQAEKRFVHRRLGWNFRITNLQAALGVAQLECLDEYVVRKRKMGAWYSERLRSIPGLQLPLARTQYAESIYWVYGLLLKDSLSFDAEEAMKRLARHGIGTRPFFWPMHEQPVFMDQGMFAGEHYVVAEKLARRGFYIPSGLGLTADQMERVVDAVKQVFS